MANGFTRRIRHLWITLLHPIWTWLLLGLLGFISLLAWIRDEFLSSALQDELKIIKLLPSWPAITWLLAFSVALLLVLFEGSYRAMRVLEEERDEFKDKLEAIAQNRPLAYVNALFNFQEPQWQTGEVFVIPDPQLRLDQLENVQNEVAALLV